MRVGCQERVLAGENALKKFQFAAECGLEGVEVGGWGLKERVDELKEAIEATGMPIVSICDGYNGCLVDPDRKEREKAIDDIKMLIEIAEKLGAGGLIVITGFGKNRIPDLSPYKDKYTLSKNLLVKLLEELLPYAQKAGVRLLLEPLFRYSSEFINKVEEAAEVVREFGSEYLGVCADFYHMFVEEKDIYGTLQENLDVIKHMHISDSTGLLPGEGNIPFDKPMSLLRENFKGYLILEPQVPKIEGDLKMKLRAFVAWAKGSFKKS